MIDVYKGCPELKGDITNKMETLHLANKEDSKLAPDEFKRIMTDVILSMTLASSKCRGYSLIRNLSWKKREYPELWDQMIQMKVDIIEDIGLKFKEPPGITKAREMLGVDKSDHVFNFWYTHIPNKEKWLAVASHRLNRIITSFARCINPAVLTCDLPSIIDQPIIVDRHTKRGSRAMDEGYSRFALLGSRVSVENSVFPPLMTRIYTQDRLPTRPEGWNFDDVINHSEVSVHLRDFGYPESLLTRFEARPQVRISRLFLYFKF